MQPTSTPTLRLSLLLRSGLRFIAGEPGTFMPAPPVVDALERLGLVEVCGDAHGVSVGMSANRRLTLAGLALVNPVEALVQTTAETAVLVAVDCASSPFAYWPTSDREAFRLAVARWAAVNRRPNPLTWIEEVSRPVSFARIRVLQPGETPWQHRDIPGVFAGPYIADGADAALDELARECGDPRMGHRAVQNYWVREADGDQEIWIELAPRGDD